MSDSFITSGSRRTGSIAWLACRAETTIFSSDDEGHLDKFGPVVLHPPRIGTHTLWLLAVTVDPSAPTPINIHS